MKQNSNASKVIEDGQRIAKAAIKHWKKHKEEFPAKSFCPILRAAAIFAGIMLRSKGLQTETDPELFLEMESCPQTKKGGCQLWNEENQECSVERLSTAMIALARCVTVCVGTEQASLHVQIAKE